MSAGAGAAAAGVFDTLVNSWMNQQARDDERRQQEAKQRTVQNAIAQGNITFDQMQDILNDYNEGRIRLADNDTVNELRTLMKDYQPQVYDFDKFSDEYNKTVEDFINPEAEKIAQLAGLETQAQMAGQGNAKGSGGLANMGYSRWKAAEDLYKDAQAQYNADRSQAYKEYGDYITNMQKKLDTISQGQLQKIQILGGAVQNEQQQQADYISDLLGIMGDKTSTNINAAMGAF